LTSARYRAAAFAHGVPFRANGLFPLGDRLLTELAADPNLRAFQKNVLSYHETPESPDADAVVSYRVAESWAHGDGAARAGLDLRCFYRETSDQNKTGPSLTAAFRLGDGAAIGKFAFTNAHGGSIETVLDETTAELVKCFRAPNCATTELRAKILKPVALHKTYRVDCWIASATQFRLRTEGKITDPEDGTTYATCEATLADLSAIEKSRR
jgi:acyl-coenzyme A thioesterase PaaI-like protein